MNEKNIPNLSNSRTKVRCGSHDGVRAVPRGGPVTQCVATTRQPGSWVHRAGGRQGQAPDAGGDRSPHGRRCWGCWKLWGLKAGRQLARRSMRFRRVWNLPYRVASHSQIRRFDRPRPPTPLPRRHSGLARRWHIVRRPGEAHDRRTRWRAAEVVGRCALFAGGASRPGFVYLPR